MHFAHTADIFTFGPVIIIISPGRASERDMRDISKLDNLTLYLPLLSPIEMEDIRATLWENKNAGNYVSRELMDSLILKFSCIPRTIFELGHNRRAQECIFAKFKTVGNVERLLDTVGGSDIDHEVGPGSLFHIVPVANFTAGYEDQDSFNISKLAKKRSGQEAGLEAHNFSERQRIALLRESYQTIVYIWTSDFICDLAFQTFLTLTADRMLTIILNHAKSVPSSFQGFVLEPFVHKWLNESGVRGRMKNLQTGKDLSVVLIKTGVFDNYKRRNTKKLIKFVWIVEAKNYDNYTLKAYHNRAGKAYARG